MATTKKQLVESLAEVPLFARCTKRDLKAVARHLEMVTVTSGTAIMTEGDQGDAFFLVLDGTVVVSADGAPPVTLATGAHFGELALLDPAPRSATVTAETDVELAALNVRMFRVILRDLPQISSGLLASLASQLRDARA